MAPVVVPGQGPVISTEHFNYQRTDVAWSEPRVQGELPGPRSRALLARQARWESNARTYPRHLPIAIAGRPAASCATSTAIVFIDFLTGAGVLSLGHNHPELVAVAAGSCRPTSTGWTSRPRPRTSSSRPSCRCCPRPCATRMKLHFCGPTGANAVDAAIKLCKTATGRGDIVSFQGGFHGSSHAAMALTGLVEQKRPIANGMPGVHFFPYSYCSRCPLGPAPRRPARPTARATWSSRCATRNGGVARPAAIILELVQGEGGVIPATPDFVRGSRR